MTHHNQSSIVRPFTSRYTKTLATHRYGDTDHETTGEIDSDYRPIRIKIFKNGDRFDAGTEIFVTRREFKHWLMLLDMITKKINAPQVVQTLYDLDGDEITEFRELEDGGQYVAAGLERFKNQIRYGRHKYRMWQPTSKHLPHHDPTSVDSHESIEIYLRKMGFESQSGKMYPFDDPDKDPETKAIIQKAALEKALQRQQMKEERAATRLSRYHSEGSLPRIEESNNVVRRYDKNEASQYPKDYYSDNSIREEKYRGVVREYDVSNRHRFFPTLPEWNSKNGRRNSYDDGNSVYSHRRYSPTPSRSRYDAGRYASMQARPKTSKYAQEIFDRLYRQRGSTAYRRKIN